MHRVPAFMMVGTIAGLAGAGVMWLFTRSSDKPNLIQTASAEFEQSRNSGTGIPRKFHPNPEFEEPDATPARTRPSSTNSNTGRLTATSTKRARDRDQNSELPPVAGNGGIAALPAFSKSASNQGSIGSILETKPSTLSQKTAVPSEYMEALTAARSAAELQKKQGFTFREEYWAGTIENGSKAVTTQLFRGNAYWFVAGTDVESPFFAVHVYDSEGNLAEEESSKADDSAAAYVVPAKTGTFYVIVSHEQTRDFMKRRTAHWALLQGYR